MDAPRITRTTGKCLSWGGWVCGIILCAAGLIFWPLFVAGIGIIILGAMAEKSTTICGACGNTVAQTSVLCPTCNASLHKKVVPIGRYFVLIAWGVLIAVVVVGTFWLMAR